MSYTGLGGVSGYSSTNAYSRVSQQMSTGKRINSAADDAAGMAIADKLDNQARGAEVAANNSRDMRNVLNLSDGAMGQVGESLGRIRELALQSMNGIYSDSDKQAFQQEIDGLKEHINDIAKNTQFNGKNVLDGSFVAQNAAIGPNGQSTKVTTGNMFTDELGITDLDVTSGNFSLDSIDEALEKVNTQRGNVGAQSNRLEHTERALENAAMNEEIARSRKEDTDYASAQMESSRQRITDQVGLQMQKMKMQSMGAFLGIMGA